MTAPEIQSPPGALSPDALADKCEAWLHTPDGLSVSNVVDAFEAGYRQCENDHQQAGPETADSGPKSLSGNDSPLGLTGCIEAPQAARELEFVRLPDGDFDLAPSPVPEARPENMRCAGCDLINGCPEYCQCTPASAPVAEQGWSSGLGLAVIGRRHFGNPIPREWYAAAKELVEKVSAPAPAVGERAATVTTLTPAYERHLTAGKRKLRQDEPVPPEGPQTPWCESCGGCYEWGGNGLFHHAGCTTRFGEAWLEAPASQPPVQGSQS